MRSDTSRSVLVLQGGPDSEREISLRSGMTVSTGLREAGFIVHAHTIQRINSAELAALPGDVIFPILHGGWGEGGPLQDILASDGRPFVGCTGEAARHAMDKVATKFTALSLGIPTPRVHLLDLRDTAPPFPLPVVLKPVHEGSTVGLYVCRTLKDWVDAVEAIGRDRAAHPERVYMVEPCVCLRGGKKARELTVGMLDGVALPVIEITPAIELYDYEAKYNREDTRYTLAPKLPSGVTETIQRQTVDLAKAMGVRHLARADFMLDDDGTAWFLEINTMPGFTDHSLVPMACRHLGMSVPEVVSKLVELAVRDHGRSQSSPAKGKRTDGLGGNGGGGQATALASR